MYIYIFIYIHDWLLVNIPVYIYTVHLYIIEIDLTIEYGPFPLKFNEGTHRRNTSVSTRRSSTAPRAASTGAARCRLSLPRRKKRAAVPTILTSRVLEIPWVNHISL